MDDRDPSRGANTWLLPALDLLNSGSSAPNVRRNVAGTGDAAAVVMRAVGSIRAGSELTWSYQNDDLRSDASMLVYGFVNEADTRLAAVDTPGCAPCPLRFAWQQHVTTRVLHRFAQLDGGQ